MPINAAFTSVLAAVVNDRRALFAAAAQRLGTSDRNVEKDFWVCLTLDALFNGLAPGGPHLLFKGGTSLSKAYGLVARSSEDIDVTVFRNDLGHAISVEELAALTVKKREARLNAIRDACRAYISGTLLEQLTEIFGRITAEAGHPAVEITPDPDETQNLEIHYASVTTIVDEYINPVVRIESGAKSALDPHAPLVIKPYVGADMPDTDFSIPNIVTIDPRRTFWDKIVILHGLRRWYDIRGELHQEGQRVSRHYYDVHRLLASDVANAIGDRALGEDCANHSRMFFNRTAFDLASAVPGTFALMPSSGMLERLRRDYDQMAMMIFGEPPSFDEVISSVRDLERRLNA
jgi:hypothetical protein